MHQVKRLQQLAENGEVLGGVTNDQYRLGIYLRYDRSTVGMTIFFYH